MTNWRIPLGGALLGTAGGNAADTTGVEVTASSVANTKGSWVELEPSMPFTVDWIEVCIKPVGVTNGTKWLVDLGIGSAGNEQIIVPDIFFTSSTVSAGGRIHFPVSVPRGVRLSARCQCSVGMGSVDVMVYYGTGGFGGHQSFSRVIAIGVDHANTWGISLGNGADWVIHTKKPWVELTSSLEASIGMISVALGMPIWATGAGVRTMFDIGVGAGGSEQELVSNLYGVSSTDEIIFPCYYGPFPVSLNAGSRIAARCQSSIGGAASNVDRSIIIYGLVK